MDTIFYQIYVSLLFVAIILYITSISTSGENSYATLLAEYSVLILAIFMIIVLVVYDNVNSEQNITTYKILFSLLSCFPYLILLVILGWLLYLNIVYKDAILNQHVINYSACNVILNILLITSLSYTVKWNEVFNKNFKIKKTKIIIGEYVIILWIILVFIYLNTSITKFVTDG
jgi:hypothetical protein